MAIFIEYISGAVQGTKGTKVVTPSLWSLYSTGGRETQAIKKGKQICMLDIIYNFIYILYKLHILYIMISDAEKVSKVRGKRIMGVLFGMAVREGFLP